MKVTQFEDDSVICLPNAFNPRESSVSRMREEAQLLAVFEAIGTTTWNTTTTLSRFAGSPHCTDPSTYTAHRPFASQLR